MHKHVQIWPRSAVACAMSQQANSVSCSISSGSSLFPKESVFILIIRKMVLWQTVKKTFANSLDPDQAQHFVGPDLDRNVWHSDRNPENFLRWIEKISIEQRHYYPTSDLLKHYY